VAITCQRQDGKHQISSSTVLLTVPSNCRKISRNPMLTDECFALLLLFRRFFLVSRGDGNAGVAAGRCATLVATNTERHDHERRPSHRRLGIP
jgi:hypothetical protein